MKTQKQSRTARIFRWIGLGVLVLLLAFSAYEWGAPMAGVWYADALMQRGRYTDACSAYRWAETCSGSRRLAGFAQTRAADGEKAAADAVYDAAYQKVIALVDAGDYSGAEAAIEQAELTDAQRLALGSARYYAMGFAAEQDGDLEEALACYLQASGLPEAEEGATRCSGRLEIARARALAEIGDYSAALAALTALGDFEDAPAVLSELTAQREAHYQTLFTAYRDRLAAGAWYTLLLGDTPLLSGDARYDPAEIPSEAEAVYGGLFGTILRLSDGSIRLYGDALCGADALSGVGSLKKAAVGLNHALALTEDGQVIPLGCAAGGRLAVADWGTAADVAVGAFHSVVLLTDGTVRAAGDNGFGQCDVSGWPDATAVAAGLYHTVALLADGTVRAAGDNSFGQCDVSGWTDVIAVYCGANHTVALTADYRLLAVGDNACGQCDVSDWTDIVAVACGAWHTVGIRADGQVAFAGSSDSGQGDVAEWRAFSAPSFPDAAPSYVAASAPGECVRGLDLTDGPWLYLSADGAVTVTRDDSAKGLPLRADLYGTEGCLITGAFAGGGELTVARELPAKIARQNRVVFGITSDYLGFGNNNRGITIRRGVLYYELFKRENLAVYPDGTLRIVPRYGSTAAEVLADGVKDSFSFGPALVVDGEVQYQIEGDPMDRWATSRTALGTMGAYHHVAVVTDQKGYLKLTDLALIFQGYGCTDAYNLDGGNSTSMVFMGEQLNQHYYNPQIGAGIRPLSDIVAFLTSESVPDPDEPYVRPTTIGG